jgi:tRNA(fMet)-specific endonuclease VapC
MHMADKAGTPMGVADAWIAATALALGCPLVTHNATDFQGVPGLPIITEPVP